ncbi:MAG: DUF503 domain-containing protein [Bacillota bacterium]
MFVSTLWVRLRVLGARSLKDKRRAVRSVLDRARSRYQVSAAETGAHADWQVAELGFAAVSNEPAHAQEIVGQVLRSIETGSDVEVLDYSIRAVKGRNGGVDSCPS